MLEKAKIEEDDTENDYYIAKLIQKDEYEKIDYIENKPKIQDDEPFDPENIDFSSYLENVESRTLKT